ncbi:MAG: hypothetical protein R3B72_28350 [Polyangiaceae bacterium]
MSNPHPTISAWTRDAHEGHYQAELHGWTLTVRWLPGGAATRGMFRWEASRPDDKPAKAEEPVAEMEHAMALAEQFAQADADRRAAEATRGAEDTGH